MQPSGSGGIERVRAQTDCLGTVVERPAAGRRSRKGVTDRFIHFELVLPIRFGVGAFSPFIERGEHETPDAGPVREAPGVAADLPEQLRRPILDRGAAVEVPGEIVPSGGKIRQEGQRRRLCGSGSKIPGSIPRQG